MTRDVSQVAGPSQSETMKSREMKTKAVMAPLLMNKVALISAPNKRGWSLLAVPHYVAILPQKDTDWIIVEDGRLSAPDTPWIFANPSLHRGTDGFPSW